MSKTWQVVHRYKAYETTNNVTHSISYAVKIIFLYWSRVLVSEKLLDIKVSLLMILVLEHQQAQRFNLIICWVWYIGDRHWKQKKQIGNASVKSIFSSLEVWNYFHKSNQMSSSVGCAVEIWEWINYFNSYFIVEVITYPCWPLVNPC